jgi:hypothetical protein
MRLPTETTLHNEEILQFSPALFSQHVFFLRSPLFLKQQLDNTIYSTVVFKIISLHGSKERTRVSSQMASACYLADLETKKRSQ